MQQPRQRDLHRRGPQPVRYIRQSGRLQRRESPSGKNGTYAMTRLAISSIRASSFRLTVNVELLKILRQAKALMR